MPADLLTDATSVHPARGDGARGAHDDGGARPHPPAAQPGDLQRARVRASRCSSRARKLRGQLPGVGDRRRRRAQHDGDELPRPRSTSGSSATAIRSTTLWPLMRRPRARARRHGGDGVRQAAARGNARAEPLRGRALASGVGHIVRIALTLIAWLALASTAQAQGELEHAAETLKLDPVYVAPDAEKAASPTARATTPCARRSPTRRPVRSTSRCYPTRRRTRRAATRRRCPERDRPRRERAGCLRRGDRRKSFRAGATGQISPRRGRAGELASQALEAERPAPARRRCWRTS